MLAVVGASGCRPSETVVTLGNEPPERRAAASFVHCVEAGTSLCVESGDESGGWDAFYLLDWLASGSPASIVQVLPRELARHADPLEVQARFVEEVERYASSVRGAECQGVDMRPMKAVIDDAAGLASHRMEDLGLWQGDMQRVVAGLAQEAHDDLDSGALVRLDCHYDPFRLYVAVRESRGRYQVVGMLTLLPPALGGAPLDGAQVDERLHSVPLGLSEAAAPVREGTVSPWLPFPVEVF